MEYFPGLTSLEILQEIQKYLQDQNIEPEKFEDGIILMSLSNDIDWIKRGSSERCISKSRIMRRDSREDSGHSSALETKRSGAELSATHLKENEIPSLHRWWNDPKKPITQCSKSTSAFESWNSEKEE